MADRIKVKKSEPAESTEVLAEAIVNIGNAAKKLYASGLNRKAVIVLIQAETRLSRKDIALVLDILPQLERWYCK